MKKIAAIALGGFVLAVGLGGCDATKEAIGVSKRSPDEFAVYRRAPLSLPPSYQLRPPEPGAPRPQDADTAQRARKALLGEGRSAESRQGDGGDRSMGEVALLRSAGALDVDPEIRRIVDRETSIYASESESFTERLMFWRDPAPAGTVVDAAKEARRIQENQALGRPVTEGDTPRIERKSKALLEGIFN